MNEDNSKKCRICGRLFKVTVFRKGRLWTPKKGSHLWNEKKICRSKECLRAVNKERALANTGKKRTLPREWCPTPEELERMKHEIREENLRLLREA
jgi:hypothetical protein